MRRFRPPPVRPVQVRRLRTRLAVVQGDGERIASFLSHEMQYYWRRAQSLESELAEVQGRLRIADGQLDAIMARWGIRRPLSTAVGEGEEVAIMPAVRPDG